MYFLFSMESLGNLLLFERKRIGYLAASRIITVSVLPTLDWAIETAKNEDVTIVSGFHSQMEREVLDFLLKGRCGIICVLARSIYKKVPPKFQEAYNADRVLFISPFQTTAIRASRQDCQQRNEFIASISDQLVFSSLTSESSLYPLFSQHPNSKLL